MSVAVGVYVYTDIAQARNVGKYLGRNAELSLVKHCSHLDGSYIAQQM